MKVFVGCVFAALAIYGLSVGPVVRFYNSRQAPDSVIGFYKPMAWIHDHTPFGPAMDAYVRLWGARLPFKLGHYRAKDRTRESRDRPLRTQSARKIIESFADSASRSQITITRQPSFFSAACWSLSRAALLLS